MVLSGEVVNVSKVPQRSPFRYPGGKTWLVPQFRAWLASLPNRPSVLVEPFAGGGIIGLTAAMEGMCDEVVMIEQDPNVAAVWLEIFYGDPEELCNRIETFDLTRDSARAVLSEPPTSNLDHAFKTILRNRVNRGGIMSPGASFVRSGENGRGVLSRWYPETLSRRITAIAAVRDRFTFFRGDALERLPAYLGSRKNAFFVDPPYTAGGKRAGNRLYAAHHLDHSKLFGIMAQAMGPVMMTYDDAEAVRELAQMHDFEVHEVMMQNSHLAKVRELLLLRNG